MHSNDIRYIKIRSYISAKIIYEYLNGECFIKTEDGMRTRVIVSVPDDSGVLVEDPDTGIEEFIEISKLYLEESKHIRLLEIKQQRS